MKQWLIIGALVVVIAVVAFVVIHRKHDAAPEEAANAPASAAPPAPAADPQEAFLTENLQKPGWKATPSGLEYTVLKSADPSAPKPATGSEVTVNYEGTLIDGTVFDSSYARNEPATFPLNGVIQGWQEGVPMMRVGEIWEFAIPARLAYGDRNVGPIPGGSTLLFKVELLSAPTPATGADTSMPTASAPDRAEPPPATTVKEKP